MYTLESLKKETVTIPGTIVYEKIFSHPLGHSVVKIISYFENDQLKLKCINDHRFSNTDINNVELEALDQFSKSIKSVHYFYDKVRNLLELEITDSLVEELNNCFKITIC